MIVSGAPCRSETGTFDEVVDGCLPRRHWLSRKRRHDAGARVKHDNPEAFLQLRNTVGACLRIHPARHHPCVGDKPSYAPPATSSTWVAERTRVGGCVTLFAERAASHPMFRRTLRGARSPRSRYGAGTMGGGIAMIFLTPASRSLAGDGAGSPDRGLATIKNYEVQ